MKTVHPYLNFQGNTEEAFTFYKSVFGGEFLMLLRYKDFADNAMNVLEAEQQKIAHIALALTPDTMLMGTDALESLGHHITVGNHSYIYLEAESAEEAKRLFDALSEGGHVEMSLQLTEWAEKHGQCRDPFGVQWMISYEGHVRFQMQEGQP